MDEAEIIAAIEEATHHRGWISNSYAQVEFLLGDLIIRSREFPEYAKQTATFTHSSIKRVTKVRLMLDIDGPLTPHKASILAILDAFETNHDIRNLLAHGFCEFHFTSTGDAGLVFRKFERQKTEDKEEADSLIVRTFRPIDMQYHREQLVALAQQALETFAKIHFDFGWGDLDPTTMRNGWFKTS